MAVVFRAAAAAALPTSAVSNRSVPVPNGVQDGDILLMFGANTGSWRFTTPSGWTLLDAGHDTVSPNGDGTGAVYWRLASNEPSSYTLASGTAWSGSTVNPSAIAAGMLAYSGVDPVAPIRSHGIKVTPSTPSTNGTPVTSATPGALATVGNDDMVVLGYGFGGDAAGTGATLSYPTTGSWNQREIIGPTQIGGTGAGRFPTGLVLVDNLAGTDLPSASSNRTAGWQVMSIALAPAPDVVGWMPFFS